MKTVFSNHFEVAHTWAQRSQSEGRAGNIFFEGGSIYSYGYHYEIAYFEKNHVVINDVGYSVSTSKHIGIVRSAVSHYEQFSISQIDTELIYNRLKDAYQSIQKARKPSKYWVYGSNPLYKFEEYLAKFDKVERKTILTNFKNEKYLPLIKKLVKKLDKFVANPKIKEVVSANIKADQEAKKRKEMQIETDRQKGINDFYNFKFDTLSYFHFMGNKALIRFNPYWKRVETSKGIKIDGKVALTLFKLIESGKDIKGYKIDNYTVISMNGVLKVGCHEISKEDVFRVGQELKTFYS